MSLVCSYRRLVYLLPLIPSVAVAQDTETIRRALQRPIIGPDLSQREVEAFCEQRVPTVPAVASREEWERLTDQWRESLLTGVVFRGEAAEWREAPLNLQWLETIETADGYRIRKLRYEALPGMWIPALLYEPTDLRAKAPVVMNVNGHDRADGKAAKYKQIRCINQAKRGMIALNVEWLGMGQLNSDGFVHYRMNQLDLCGTSGLAPFILSMQRGLDVLLSHEFADPQRVAVAGLSGGGWQTIFISAIDRRVALCNPVAGYSSFRTRIHNHSDLGDSEQTPCDMATVADYSHLTAMMAPRATLLTFNEQDQCCFAAGHALQPLLNVAEPVFKLYQQPERLRSHVNFEPGTHNFDRDNREALYRMFASNFYEDDPSFVTAEIACDDELKTNEELHVALPDHNQDFHTLASTLSRDLPRNPLPTEPTRSWREQQREKLSRVVRGRQYTVHAEQVATDSVDGVQITGWRLKLDDDWTIPATEFASAKRPADQTAIVISDDGRASATDTVKRLLEEGFRVLAVDPFYVGESKIKSRDFLFALLVSAVGERPLGVQASQVSAIGRWLKQSRGQRQVVLAAVGERMSLAALTAAALDELAVDQIELSGCLDSLKQVIERNYAVNQQPEFFCFGLLQSFDIPHLRAMVSPRPIRHQADD